MLCHNIFVQFSRSSFLRVHKCTLGYKILYTLKLKSAESDSHFKAVEKVAKKVYPQVENFRTERSTNKKKFLHSFTYGDNFVTFSTDLIF
jgi:hypothetical protein